MNRSERVTCADNRDVWMPRSHWGHSFAADPVRATNDLMYGRVSNPTKWGETHEESPRTMCCNSTDTRRLWQ